jgi:hypothetical protein
VTGRRETSFDYWGAGNWYQVYNNPYSYRPNLGEKGGGEVNELLPPQDPAEECIKANLPQPSKPVVLLGESHDGFSSKQLSTILKETAPHDSRTCLAIESESLEALEPLAEYPEFVAGELASGRRVEPIDLSVTDSESYNRSNIGMDTRNRTMSAVIRGMLSSGCPSVVALVGAEHVNPTRPENLQSQLKDVAEAHNIQKAETCNE